MYAVVDIFASCAGDDMVECLSVVLKSFDDFPLQGLCSFEIHERIRGSPLAAYECQENSQSLSNFF